MLEQTISLTLDHFSNIQLSCLLQNKFSSIVTIQSPRCLLILFFDADDICVQGHRKYDTHMLSLHSIWFIFVHFHYSPSQEHQEQRALWLKMMRDFFKENGIKKSGQIDQKTGKEIWSNGKEGKDATLYH